MPKKLTTKDFIKRAKEVHGEKYDYSKVDYVNSATKVVIICPKHGEFEQRPNDHLRGNGCPSCKQESLRRLKYSTGEIVNRFTEVHGDRYDYSKVEYVGMNKNVTIVCKEHGEFEQTPYLHLNGSGCNSCAIKQRGLASRKTTEQFIKEAKEIHGEKYDYSEVDYITSTNKVKIICLVHGEFEQEANSHLRGSGCPHCGSESSSEVQKYSTEDFISRAVSIHGGVYDYSLVEYVSSQVNVKIICKEHGEFEQRPNDHLMGKGCSKCAKLVSKPELELIEFIKSFGLEVEHGNRKILGGRELDIVVPSKKIAIEYNGLEFHREGLVESRWGGKNKKYHLQKTLDAKEEGYDLIHIFEDEWLDNKGLIKSKIAHILGVSQSKKIYARKCKIKQIMSKVGKELLNKHHVQGSDSCGINFGAFYNDELVAVMTFRKEKTDGHYKLNRFATDTNYRIVGIASKLLKAFEREYCPIELNTYSDRRWSTDSNNVYTSIGFKNIGSTEPGYFYYNTKNSIVERLSRQKFMKYKLLEQYPQYDKSWTEKEIMIDLGYDRIWDCGHFKYVKTYEK